MEAFSRSVEPDGALIEWSVRGGPDAFVEVAQRHEVAVHGFLARRAGREVADDLLAEVWLRAFAARGGYDPAHADALPWLYGIARNVLREHWRASLQAAEAPAPDVVDPWDEVNARLDSDASARAWASADANLSAARWGAYIVSALVRNTGQHTSV
jgi:DNA-directed RNA polymerase specialized sigma24 family protein